MSWEEAIGECLEHWEDRPHLARGGGSRARLLDAGTLSTLLGHIDPADAQVFEGQSRVHGDTRRSLGFAFLHGGSIVLNRLDLLCAPVCRLCIALRPLVHHAFAVLYVTPRGDQSVGAHSDDQDVFILQLAGTKHWTVYGSPVRLPYTDEMVGKPGGPPVDPDFAASAPVLDTELRPGDVLYVPRGAVHEARAAPGGASVHVTVTVQTSDLNWGAPTPLHVAPRPDSSARVARRTPRRLSRQARC